MAAMPPKISITELDNQDETSLKSDGFSFHGRPSTLLSLFGTVPEFDEISLNRAVIFILSLRGQLAGRSNLSAEIASSSCRS
jgi:hypothetical protein